MHAADIREEVRRRSAAGENDCAIARELGLARTTVRDIRRAPPRPHCPRCWRRSRPMRFTDGAYAELLGLYLGDGHISRLGRTFRLRLSLDAKHDGVVQDACALLAECFKLNEVGVQPADDGATAVVWVHSSHLPCLFPQHGPGAKHHRPIVLEDWQQRCVDAAPWSFLRGLVHSDGCFFVNRTGRYRYLSVEFANHSSDVLDLFTRTCDRVGVPYRRYERSVRLYRREAVVEFACFVGSKR